MLKNYQKQHFYVSQNTIQHHERWWYNKITTLFIPRLACNDPETSALFCFITRVNLLPFLYFTCTCDKMFPKHRNYHHMYKMVSWPSYPYDVISFTWRNYIHHKDKAFSRPSYFIIRVSTPAKICLSLNEVLIPSPSIKSTDQLCFT